jgi:uncharacterized membrane protein
MLKAILFAIAFVLLGLVAFALIAPLILGDADLRKAGAVAFPFIVVVCGAAGFAVGIRHNKKS